jgi:hypothetical protein
MFTPHKRVGEVFVLKFFTKNEAKPNEDISKNDANHKLGDVHGTPNINTNLGFQIFQLFLAL